MHSNREACEDSHIYSACAHLSVLVCQCVDFHEVDQSLLPVTDLQLTLLLPKQLNSIDTKRLRGNPPEDRGSCFSVAAIVGRCRANYTNAASETSPKRAAFVCCSNLSPYYS